MKHTLTAAAAALAITLLTVPAFASEPAQTPSAYQTSLTQTGVLASPGSYLGNLRINVSPEGLVSGWYRPSDGEFVSVTGNFKDGKMWLYVGQRGDLTISAALQKDGSLVGTALERAPRFDIVGAAGPTTYDFTASPQTAVQTY